ncbi:MAG: CAP domain-containing protein [Anaerolineales bacterium]
MQAAQRKALLLLLLALTLFGIPEEAALQEDPARTLYEMINQARLEEGLPPLGWSKLLNQAAQAHAEDMAAHTLTGSEGSDGSTHQQRIREVGYQAWHDGLLVNEFVWLGLGSAENALRWLLNQPEQWSTFTREDYREVGIGFATDAGGVNYFVVDFGSRPGVLPIFINDGAETTDSPVVAVRLTNEEAVPLGEVSRMGKAIEVRISEDLDFTTAEWQPWEALLPWTLGTTEPGTYPVYVEFRDGAGRTTRSEDTIRLVSTGETREPTAELPEVTPETEPSTPTPEPETTEAAPPPPAETGAPPLPTYVPEATAPTPAAATPAPEPTWTPLPTPTLFEGDGGEELDWTLLTVLLLQALAWALGIALLLRRHG